MATATPPAGDSAIRSDAEAASAESTADSTTEAEIVTEPSGMWRAIRRRLGEILGVFASILLHIAVLAAFWFIKLAIVTPTETENLETSFTEDYVPEQDMQMESDTSEISENLNPNQTGGTVTTTVGASAGPTVSEAQITESMVVEESDFKIPEVGIAMVSDGNLGDDLGESQVTGETGALVEGYGAALSRIAMELARMMREDPLLVVWLFDESESMKDDQEEIRANFTKVYAELKLLQDREETLRRNEELILTMVGSYGENLRFLNRAPTADVKEIQDAIGSIPIDASGKENMCAAIFQAIRKYGPAAVRARPKRKLVVIVVSDESGDDGEGVERALDVALTYKAPIFVMGRESVFGYPTARYRYVDERGLPHWLPMRRGPETAFREALQWNGLHRRWDADRAGFGPYEQTRLAYRSGGIFFLLPSEDKNIVGRDKFDKEKLAYFDLQKYKPLLLSREDYVRKVMKNDFRREISRIIDVLDPKKDKLLSIRSENYSIDPIEFQRQASTNFAKAARAMAALSEALAILEKIAPARASEDSDRWRANFDLIEAQCLAYRVSLFQYMLALDDHLRTKPVPKKPDTNRWDVRRTKTMRVPDEEQFGRIKNLYKLKADRETFLAELKRQQDRAAGLYRQVIENHPRTPWARRAQEELSRGFGYRFAEEFYDPRYREPVKLPKL